jgi:hypothetical protein
VADRRIARPGRDQAPANGDQLALGAAVPGAAYDRQLRPFRAVADDGHAVARGDVEPRPEIAAREVAPGLGELDAERALDQLGLDAKEAAATHGGMVAGAPSRGQSFSRSAALARRGRSLERRRPDRVGRCTTEGRASARPFRDVGRTLNGRGAPPS